MNSKKPYDYLIVGAGLFGATFAHEAHKAGKRCLVVDKRLQTGGNLHCRDIDGIQVHEYGAHIFHTDKREVWEYVNQLVEFNRYTNSPLARYKDRLYNLPFLGRLGESVDTQRELSITMNAYFRADNAPEIGKGYNGYEVPVLVRMGLDGGKVLAVAMERVKLSMPEIGTDGAAYTLDRNGAILGTKGEDALYIIQE